MHLGTSRGSDRLTPPLPHILISCSPYQNLGLGYKGGGQEGNPFAPPPH